MNWKLCIDSTQKRALKLCRGSMDEGEGWGSDGFDGYGVGWGYCDGAGAGAGTGWSYGSADGDGYGSGYGIDGGSPEEWD